MAGGYGAIAGGIASGIERGQAIELRNRRMAIEEEDAALRKNADQRAAEAAQRTATEHGWKQEDRANNDAYYAEAQRILGGLKREDGAEFDPIRNPEDGVKYTLAQGDLMAARFKYKLAKPEETEKYMEFRKKLRTEQFADTWQRFTASGFNDVGLLAPIAEERGMDPASMKVEFRKTEGGYGGQYMLSGKKKDGSEAPPVPLSIIASAFSKEGASAIDKAEDNVRAGQIAQATIEERRAAAAASTAAKEHAIAARGAIERGELANRWNTTLNDIRKDVIKPTGKDAMGNIIDDEPYNAYAAKRVEELADQITGGKQDMSAVTALASKRGTISSKVRTEINDIERQATTAAKKVWDARNGKDPKAREAAEAFWQKIGKPASEKALAKILRDDKLSSYGRDDGAP